MVLEMNGSAPSGAILLQRVLLAAMVVLTLSACSHWPRVKVLGEDLYYVPFPAAPP